MEPIKNPSALHPGTVHLSSITRIPIGSVTVADSPRRTGVSSKHVRTLAESGEPLLPIIVHRSTMRVIDGMHRLSAAKLRGQEEIEVRFFDGDEMSSFVIAVQFNVLHGLPLSLSDRKAAASRIISSYPRWSDRMIASVTGLAAKTVAAVRDGLTEEKHHLDARLGRDGRVRPLDSTARRQVAARIIAARPGASLREVAEEAGLSPETVRNVRARLARGDSPVSTGVERSDHAPPDPSAGSAAEPRPDAVSPVEFLRADPAFRSTQNGRLLLRMMYAAQALEGHGERIIDHLPAHCITRVAQAAHICTRIWGRFAENVDRRAKTLAQEKEG